MLWFWSMIFLPSRVALRSYSFWIFRSILVVITESPCASASWNPTTTFIAKKTTLKILKLNAGVSV